MSALVPDVLGFVLSALEADGALCEAGAGPDAARATALLPRDVAKRLEVPEECALAVQAEGKCEVACGLGSPLLEKLVAEARAKSPVVSLRATVDPPRPSHVRSVCDRFVLRNGLAEVGQVTMGTVRYAIAFVAYTVEADDRREGLVRVVTAADGGEPDADVAQKIDPTWPDLAVQPSLAIAPDEGSARWIAIRGNLAVRAAAAPFIGDVARRHGRDHERIASYFAALIAEARAPRRKVEQKALDAKVAHLLAERDKKLRDLGERYATRVRASLAAVAWAELPASLVSMKLRRRKESREITLRVPAWAHAADKLACEGCGAPTPKPAACDDRLHLLCEACAPSAQGRITCPACAKRR